ncbi:MAG: hypothetical protein LZ167_07830 [Thaumarchaeota archaeon]|nr:hypothetical protein [Candidatus Geocrenenecus arthurdayi]MCL7390108.1 hypothetical protein [Candidatus Geocrenenecus arthurdayi]MCL7397304.1 hypothetical protein [Candidatus Geocrenenecus arthurdayi]
MLRIVDSKPIEMKKLSRFGRYRKREDSSLVKDEESVGFNPLKMDSK